MTEQQLRDLAARFGLTVEKRITTGNERTHFATFELSGDRVRDAWPVIKGDEHPAILRTPSNPEYPDRRPYIEVESVWCEVGICCPACGREYDPARIPPPRVPVGISCACCCPANECI